MPIRLTAVFRFSRNRQTMSDQTKLDADLLDYVRTPCTADAGMLKL